MKAESPTHSRPFAPPMQRVVPPTRRRDPDPTPGKERTGDVAIAFGALLTALRTSQQAFRTSDGSTAPTEMFEPAAKDTHELKLSTFKADDRAHRLQADGEGQSNKGELDALRSSRDGRGAESGFRSRPGGSVTSNAAKEAANRSESTNAALGPDRGRGARGPTDLQGSSPIKPGGKGSGAGAGSTSAANAQVLAGIGDSDGSAVSPESPAVAAGAASRVISPGKGQTVSQSPPAQQVARILSAARPGESESMRAASASPMADDARGSKGDPKSAETKLPARALPTEGSLSRSDGVDPSRETKFDRLVRSLRLRTGTRYSTARMYLDPPRLGRMRVNVQMTAGHLQVDVQTETAEARRVLMERVKELKSTLEHAGIEVDRFDVVVQRETGDVPQSFAQPDKTDDGHPNRRFRSREDRTIAGGSPREDDGTFLQGAAAMGISGTGSQAGLDIRA